MGSAFPSSFDELLSRGAPYMVVLEVEGLPGIFPEIIPLRHDAEATMTLPAAYEWACDALVYDDGTAHTNELDRDVGFGRGDGVDFILAWEPLERDGLTQTIFKTPTKRALLRTAFEHNATQAAVDWSAQFTETTRVYLGRETFKVRDAGAQTLDVTDRNGLRYTYRPGSPTAFGQLTDTPEIWTRRFVTVHIHLLSPEGRALDSTWLEGNYHRVAWRGWIEKPPKPDRPGMVLRALPLVRLAGQTLGYELGVQIVTPDVEDRRSFASIPIVVTPEAALTLDGSFTGGGGGDFNVTVRTVDEALGDNEVVTTIGEWAASMATALDDALLAQPWYVANTVRVAVAGMAGGIGVVRDADPGVLIVSFRYDTSYDVTVANLIVMSGPGAYWLTPGTRVGKKGLAGEPTWTWYEAWPTIAPTYAPGSWLPVVQTSGEGYADLTIPDIGVAMIEVDGVKELIRWDRTLGARPPQDNIRLLHIQERGVGATPRLDLAAGGELKFVSGADGTPKEVVLKILQSSGTGTRGTYDTLGLGQGLGIPAAWIDEESFHRIELIEERISAYSDGRTSLEDLMGGWFALQGLCVTQRRSALDSSLYRLQVVRTEPMVPASEDDLLVTLLPTDVEMGGVGVPDTIDSATEVRVSRSGVERDLPDVVPQDLPAIQAMGLVTKEYSAPGMPEERARDAANSRIAAGLGQTVIQMASMPWLNLQAGDVVRDKTRHPASYDWATGTRRPVQIDARVVGERWTPRGGRTTVTMLRAGLAPSGIYLARSATVAVVYGGLDGFATSSDSDGARFAPSGLPIKVTLYNPGQEATERDVFDVVLDGAGDWLLATGSVPAWVEGDKTRMSFGPLGTNDPLIEAAFMFVSFTRRWGF